MTDQHCPLCADRYDDRTDLQVHLEVEHRKSEMASYLIDAGGQSPGVPRNGSVRADREPRAPST